MLETVNELVTSIVVVIILATFLELLLPEGRLQRYVRLVIGLLIVLIMLNPVVSILENENFNINPDIFAQKTSGSAKEEILTRGKEKQQENLQTVDSQYEDAVLQESQYIVSSISQSLKIANLELDYIENNESPDYGKINKMKIYLQKQDIDQNKKTDKEKKKQEKEKLVEPVKEIIIDYNDQTESQKNEKSVEANENISKEIEAISEEKINIIEEELARTFRIEKSAVEVKVINKG